MGDLEGNVVNNSSYMQKTNKRNKCTWSYAYCCANSTPGLKSITVNKRKLNNKHTQRTQEFTWFGKLLTSTATTEKFHHKIKRYNSAQEHSQETQIPIHHLSHPQDKKTLFFLLGFQELLSHTAALVRLLGIMSIAITNNIYIGIYVRPTALDS